MRAQHLDYLDDSHGFAIGHVLVSHFVPVPGINLGAVIVHFFVALSGLFMSPLLFMQEVPIGEFYKRRISRIFPAAFFMFTVLTFFIVNGTQVNWTGALMAVLFINNYFPSGPGNVTVPCGHILTLSVKTRSYVPLTLLAFAVRRRIRGTAVFTGRCAAVSALGWTLLRQTTGAWSVTIAKNRTISSTYAGK